MRYSRLLAHYPGVVIAIVCVFSAVCLLVIIIMGEMPDFSDPTLGFEPRGTVIGARIRSYEKLLDETNSDMTFATNTFHYVNRQMHAQKAGNRSEVKKDKVKGRMKVRRKLMVKVKQHKVKVSGEEDEDEEVTVSDPFFCGPPQKEYARYTFRSMTNQNLFTFNNIRFMCRADARIRKHVTFKQACVRKTHTRGCCRSWSLPNYVALLSNRSSCFNVTHHDVTNVLSLLETCAPFYRKMMLVPDCDETESIDGQDGTDSSSHRQTDSTDQSINQCRKVPVECRRHNAIYNILHYLTDVEFMRKKSYGGSSMLRYAMTLMPIAAGTAAEPLYWKIMGERSGGWSPPKVIPTQTPTPKAAGGKTAQIAEDDLEIYAMNLGIKHLLFDHYLKRDTVWFGVGCVVLVLMMWLFSGTLFLTFIAVLCILLSLGVTYFLYTFVLEVHFFPFMNLLAIVILVGIGFDDVFIYCKVWALAKSEKNVGTLEKVISDTLKHALLGMLVTSFTTSAAFYASVISRITSLACFALFAGTSVIVNYVIMMTLVPAAMVIHEKWNSECMHCNSAYKLRTKVPLCGHMCRLPTQAYYTFTEWTRVIFEKILPCIVVHVRYFWLLTFGGVAVFGMIVIFYHPRLRLPTSNEFQVFSPEHPFEVYDFKIKDEFWFEKAAGASNPTMPLTLVWGIHPVDNGDRFDPYSEVTLEYDYTLNISSPESQKWLLDFCRALRSTQMYQKSAGPQLTNCFIENFKLFMERRSCEGFSGENYTPCCRTSTFPYAPAVFQKCVRAYRPVLANTPALFFSNNHAGMRYSRETGAVVGLIVEFNSKQPFTFNYKHMDNFNRYMEEWMQEQLLTAPPGLKNGFFTSHLEFYDLQHSIATGTPLAIGVSIAIATVMAFLTTLNVLITIHAMISIMGCIFTTVGILVMLGWELNILESVTISIAVGLSIDFTLHYAMAYRLSPHSDREMRVVTSMSRMGAPVAMAALTTFTAGAAMFPATVLAYRKLGTFLMVVMAMSWAFSTVFFQALMRTLGPPGGFGQFSCPTSDCMSRESDHVDKTVYTMSESTLSSVGGTHGNSMAEMHELEPLTSAERSENYRNHTNRYGNARARYQPRLSVSSAGSESPRSRTSPRLRSNWGKADGGRSDQFDDAPSPALSAQSLFATGTSPNLSERSSTSGSRSRKAQETPENNDIIVDDSDVIVDVNDVMEEASSDRTCNKRHTIVSLSNSMNSVVSSGSRPSVHLVQLEQHEPPRQIQNDQFRSLDEKLTEIPTDSNSNRTDVNTDKHNSVDLSNSDDVAKIGTNSEIGETSEIGVLAGAPGAGANSTNTGIWLKQTVPPEVQL